MDEMRNDPYRSVNPRRKKRSQMQIFKEAYLPIIIAGIVVLLIIIFIIGSISRAIERRKAETEASIAAASSMAEEEKRLSEEAQELIIQAEALVAQYDYSGAIGVLENFSGNMHQFPTLADKYAEYVDAQRKLVAWNDPGKVVNLSFQLLIADPARAFADKTYGSSYEKNFMTVNEFSAILQQLYDNGYVLVGLDDVFDKTLYLPDGKKPLILTQTQVNYNTYMIDGDGDKLPDKDGAGFASKLVLDNGKITCEMVDSNGNTVRGNYDLVPILDAFVEAHPDFSYKGAKAVLAVTGYDGLFGYRTNPAAKDYFGADAYSQAVAAAGNIASALRTSGYEIACYTYSNTDYSYSTAAQIKADLLKWKSEVLPILGEVDILAFARNGDINASGEYSGDKFNALQDAGFRYYLGFSTDGKTWATVADSYVRMGRILVTGSNIKQHPDWFADMFDVRTVAESIRGYKWN